MSRQWSIPLQNFRGWRLRRHCAKMNNHTPPVAWTQWLTSGVERWWYSTRGGGREICDESVSIHGSSTAGRPAGNEKVLWFSMEDKWKDFFTSFSFCNNGLFLNGRTLTMRCNSRTYDGIWFKQDDWCAILRNLWHTIIGRMWPYSSLPTILRPFKGPWFWQII